MGTVYVNVHNHSRRDGALDLKHKMDTKLLLRSLLQMLFHMSYMLLFEFLACRKPFSLQLLKSSQVKIIYRLLSAGRANFNGCFLIFSKLILQFGTEKLKRKRKQTVYSACI